MFGTQLTAANTIQKLDEGLWCMEYKGDYGFDGFLAQGGVASDAEMAEYIVNFLSWFLEFGHLRRGRQLRLLYPVSEESRGNAPLWPQL